MAKLYIIAGHGAGDPGAVGGGQNEAERVRALAARIKALGGDDVEVLDTNRNWYKDKGISSLSLPNGAMLLELHRDSGPESARGAHVIIKDGLDADAFDKALADKLSKILPGRSNIIVKRSDLANPKRAAAKGINYRLAEVGFISNADDRNIFDTRMDEIATAILEAAGIKASSTPSKPQTEQKPQQSTQQKPSKYDADIAELQKECNAQGFSNQTVDGIAGPNTLAGCPTVRQGAKGSITKWVQKRLLKLGYQVPNGGADGIFGAGTASAVRKFQSDHGLTADGIVGKNTWRKLLGM